MHEGHHGNVGIGLQGFFYLAGIDRPSPGILDRHRLGAAADHVLHHAAAEYAVDAHQHLGARLH